MKIMFVGDISLGEYYPSFGHGPRTYLNNKNVFEKVQPIFDSADFIVGNLEASITDHNFNPDDPERMVLRGNPEHANVLKVAGFKVLQVANNHTVQHGDNGFYQSIDIINKLDIKAVGLNNEQIVCIEKDGLRIGFLAASDVPDNTNKLQTQYQKLDDAFITKICAEVNNYDHLVVMLHWGLEASTTPLPYQREITEKLYKAGVSAIIGSHPHLFYEIEKRDNFISAYSLGNFVFDLCWDKKMLKSGVLSIDFREKSLNAELWPIDIKDNGCLPTPSGDPIPIDNTLTLYNLGDAMRFQQIKKTAYLIRCFLNGNTVLKIRFFINKFLKITKLSH